MTGQPPPEGDRNLRDPIAAIGHALDLGRLAEADNPHLGPLVAGLTDQLIDWIASWLASEGIGPRAPFTDVRPEYGVFVDRTSKGLGHYLADVRSDLSAAQRAAAGIRYPVTIRRRLRGHTDWTDL